MFLCICVCDCVCMCAGTVPTTDLMRHAGCVWLCVCVYVCVYVCTPVYVYVHVCAGIVPTTDLMRHAGGAQKAFARYVLHGMLRFAKLTRTVPQAAGAICALATDDKYKGNHPLTGTVHREPR